MHAQQSNTTSCSIQGETSWLRHITPASHMLQESGWWHGKPRALVNPEQSSSYLLIWLSFLNGRQLHQLTSNWHGVGYSMSAVLSMSHNSISHNRWASSNSQPNPNHPSGCHPPTSPVIQPGNKLCKRRRSDHCTSQAQEGHKYCCPLSPEETPHESCCESPISLPGQHGTWVRP